VSGGWRVESGEWRLPGGGGRGSGTRRLAPVGALDVSRAGLGSQPCVGGGFQCEKSTTAEGDRQQGFGFRVSG